MNYPFVKIFYCQTISNPWNLYDKELLKSSSENYCSSWYIFFIDKFTKVYVISYYKYLRILLVEAFVDIVRNIAQVTSSCKQISLYVNNIIVGLELVDEGRGYGDHIIYPKRHFVESSYCRIVKLPKLYNVECHIWLNRYSAERHFPDTSFSRKSFSRIVI